MKLSGKFPHKVLWKMNTKWMGNNIPKPGGKANGRGWYCPQTTREVGVKSHASCIDVIMFGFIDIFKVAHLKENIVILLENKTKSL